MADAREFFESAGRSLQDAQAALTEGAAEPPGVAIAEAQLEVRAVLDRSERGFDIQPLGGDLARRGSVDPGLVSTVTLRFVAVANRGPTGARRSVEDVINEVRGRPDLARLRQILGELRFQPVFVEAGRRWLVQVQDPAGRVVREVVVPDDA